MADDTKKKEKQEDSKAKKSNKEAKKGGKKAPVGGILPWIIMAVVIALCAGAGLGLGRLLASSSKAETIESSQQDESAQAKSIILKVDDSTTDSQKTWYYDLEPVVANLDVPGATRFVRAALILEINPQVKEKQGRDFLDDKKPILTNWLTIYLASLSLEDIRGDRNLKRIQSQILDAFNEKLFPDAKPQIKCILFKEFAIQ